MQTPQIQFDAFLEILRDAFDWRIIWMIYYIVSGGIRTPLLHWKGGKV